MLTTKVAHVDLWIGVERLAVKRPKLGMDCVLGAVGWMLKRCHLGVEYMLRNVCCGVASILVFVSLDAHRKGPFPPAPPIHWVIGSISDYQHSFGLVVFHP